MKPVFKCDYCSKMGTEEEIREHEPKCTDNYDRKNCHTCIHKKIKTCGQVENWGYECKAGKEIPDGKMFEFCEYYERKEMPSNLSGLFGEFFNF